MARNSPRMERGGGTVPSGEPWRAGPTTAGTLVDTERPSTTAAGTPAGSRRACTRTNTYASDGGVVEFEFVDAPALSGDTITYTYKTKDRKRAQAGAVVAQLAVMKGDNELIGGGSNKLKSELGPNDTGASSIRPQNYTSADGDYSINITIGNDVRTVKYRIQSGSITAW